MASMLTTTCKGCGTELSGETEDELVSVVLAHIETAHSKGHEPSREQVLSIIRKRGVHES